MMQMGEGTWPVFTGGAVGLTMPATCILLALFPQMALSDSKLLFINGKFPLKFIHFAQKAFIDLERMAFSWLANALTLQIDWHTRSQCCSYGSKTTLCWHSDAPLVVANRACPHLLSCCWQGL